MDSNDFIQRYVKDSNFSLSKMSSDTQLMSEVTNIADECVSRLQKGKKLLFAGNGGSAADCQHMAGEYVSRFLFNRDGLPAIALTTEWEEFKNYDFSKMMVFDGRKIIESNFYSIGSC